MRKLIAGIGLSLALGAAGDLFAQAPTSQPYERKEDVSTGAHRQTFTEQRIFERANRSAQERLARIESRHRAGISVERPTIYPSATQFIYFSPWYCTAPHCYAYQYSYHDWVK